LDSQTDCNVNATVENLKDMIAKQATELAPGSFFGNQFDTPVASFTLGANEVGLSHVR
jgi:hypothetical protein